MKLFKLEIGNTTAFAAADSLEDMNERKADVDDRFAFLPVQIDELVIEGYEINVTKLDNDAGKVFEYREDQQYIVQMNRDQLKSFLSERNIEFKAQMGENKLRELALKNS